jgi:hypothetical protein
MSKGNLRRAAATLTTLVAIMAFVAPLAQAAPPTPEEDPFYHYAGATPLASIAPGRC